jgi:hypothetical protein
MKWQCLVVLFKHLNNLVGFEKLFFHWNSKIVVMPIWAICFGAFAYYQVYTHSPNRNNDCFSATWSNSSRFTRKKSSPSSRAFIGSKSGHL